MKATKPNRLKFISLMTKELLSIGAVETGNNDDINKFTLETLYGKLFITIFGEHDHKLLYSVYTRFETGENVPNTININRYSGKRNQYVPTDTHTPNEAVEKIIKEIKVFL
jgi:hypothetical protein